MNKFLVFVLVFLGTYLCEAAEKTGIVLCVKGSAVDKSRLKSYEIYSVFREFSVDIEKTVFLSKKRLRKQGDVYIFLIYLSSGKKIDQLCAFLRDEVDVVFAGRADLIDVKKEVVFNGKENLQE